MWEQGDVKYHVFMEHAILKIRELLESDARLKQAKRAWSVHPSATNLSRYLTAWARVKPTEELIIEWRDLWLSLRYARAEAFSIKIFISTRLGSQFFSGDVEPTIDKAVHYYFG